MSKHNIKELDMGQLEIMWQFLKFKGKGISPNDVDALQHNLDVLREFMIKKTGRPETICGTEYSMDDIGTVINIIVCTAMRIYLDGGLDIIREKLVLQSTEKRCSR